MEQPLPKRKRIIVLGLYPTEDILSKENNRQAFKDKFCAVISIVDPNQTSPFETAGLHTLPNVHITRFLDLNQEQMLEHPDLAQDAAQKEDIQALIDFLKERIQIKGRIYIHCHMGYSRSPAVAILAAHLMGHSPQSAAELILREVMPGSHPNPWVLELADTILRLPKDQGMQAFSEILRQTPKRARRPAK